MGPTNPPPSSPPDALLPALLATDALELPDPAPPLVASLLLAAPVSMVELAPPVPTTSDALVAAPEDCTLVDPGDPLFELAELLGVPGGALAPEQATASDSRPATATGVARRTASPSTIRPGFR
jgi:hypothetical protein